ncbi:MAG TPA: WG repeat-containing protein, partial [Pyrinomonadaceae bacterium]|nr:WG repeat-containing protein [Pyrinomonadaceae bacterium]
MAQEERPNNLFEIKVDGKTGFIDQTGKIVIEPKLGGVYEFSEGLAAAYVGKGQFDEGYIDENGAVAIAPKFNIASKFSEGFAWAGIDPNRMPYKLGPLTLYSTQSTHSFVYNIGFIDKTGKWLTEPVYTFARDFSEGLAVVRTKENKFGFIDKSGKVKIEAKFDWASSFSNGLAAVFVEGKHGFIDKEGKYVIKPKYSNAFDFSEGLACVKIGGRVRKPSFGDQVITTGNKDLNYAYIDVTGKVVFRINAFGCAPFSEGVARVELGGKWRFINKTGEVTFSTDIDALGDFSEGLAVVLLPG